MYHVTRIAVPMFILLTMQLAGFGQGADSNLEEQFNDSPKYRQLTKIAVARNQAINEKRALILESHPQIIHPREARAVLLPLPDEDRNLIIDKANEYLESSPRDWLGLAKAMDILSTDTPSKRAEKLVLKMFTATPYVKNPMYWSSIESGIRILAISGSPKARDILVRLVKLPKGRSRDTKNLFPDLESSPDALRFASLVLYNFVLLAPVDSLEPFMKRIEGLYTPESGPGRVIEEQRLLVDKILGGDVDATLETAGILSW